jgi:hypothetical protein
MGGVIVSVFDAFDDDALEAADDELPAGEVTRHGMKGHGKIAKRDQPQKVWHWWARRASSLGEPLDALYKVHQWQKRLLAKAYAKHSDLLDLVGSVPDCDNIPTPKCPPGTDPDEWEKKFHATLSPHRRRLEQVNETALDREGATKKANRGTAFHGFHDRLVTGDAVHYASPEIRAGLEVLEHLLRYFQIHATETFTVFEDLNPPAGQKRIPSCGTFDWYTSPKPGYLLFAPDGEILTCKDRLIGDTKSGDQDIQKPSYETQPVPYVRGQPYDYTLTEARRKDGENGFLSWMDDIAPNQYWALIAHVPLSRVEDAGLYWGDVTQGERWARAAEAMRALCSEAQRTAKKNFYVCDGPVPDPDYIPEPVELIKAEPVALATVTSLPVEKLLAECKRLEDIDAVYLANRSRWSAELGVAAREQAEKIERGEATS